MKTRSLNTTVKKVISKRSLPKINTQHVIPLGNGWVVKREGAKTFTVITDNKREAVSIATTIAKTKKTDLVVYSKDGTVEQAKSYAS